MSKIAIFVVFPSDILLWQILPKKMDAEISPCVPSPFKLPYSRILVPYTNRKPARVVFWNKFKENFIFSIRSHTFFLIKKKGHSPGIFFYALFWFKGSFYNKPLFCPFFKHLFLERAVFCTFLYKSLSFSWIYVGSMSFFFHICPFTPLLYFVVEITFFFKGAFLGLCFFKLFFFS